MSAAKHHVTIKGVKDGLVFQLDDACPFDELIAELTHKLEKTHHQILTGPVMHVFVKLGARSASDEEVESIRSIIGQRGNLLIQSVESVGHPDDADLSPPQLEVFQGMIRSGQTLRFASGVMVLGDVNPGGTVLAAGDIYIMGSLRGVAHAGAEGDERSVIAASHLRPTQLRIAGVVSRPPDEWGFDEAFMEFAYIRDGVMEIDKIQHIAKVRALPAM